MGGHHVEQSPGTLHLDAQTGADGLAAVGGDQVVGLDGERLVGVPVLHHRGYCVGVLGPLDEFVVVEDAPRCPLLGVPAQQRLEADLGVVARRAGAVLLVACSERAAAEGVHLEDRAGVERAVTALLQRLDAGEALSRDDIERELKPYMA